MNWLREKLIYIALIYINFNLILRLIERSIYIENFDYGFASLLFLIGFLIYWFYSYVLRKGIYRILVTLLLFSVGGTCYLRKTEVLRDIFNKYLLKNIIILNDLIYEGSTTYFYQYKIIFALIIPLVTILILWITFRFMRKFILIVSLGVVITLWFSNCDAVVKEHLFIYLFISSLTFIIMSYIKKIQQYKSEGVRISLKFHYIILYGVIASLIISKITIMLPQEYKGRDISSFGNYFENKFAAEKSGTSSVNKDRYRLSSSGYGGNDRKLGGAVILNYQEVFKVKSDKPYYLKGNVNDLYDGNKWGKSNEIYYKKLGSKDMHYVKFGMSKEMYKKKSLTIYPDKKFKTNTIFVPNYTFNVNDVQGTLLYDTTPTILSEKVVTKPYNVDFYEYSEAMDTIEDVRDYSKRILENQNNLETNFVPSVPMDYYLQPKSKDISTVINKHSLIQDKFLYRKETDVKVVMDYGEYLQVPENISDRIYDLVMNITKDSDSSIEKVIEIKKYLTKNYMYDLQVTAVPDDKEFIDYFLFKEKKGYCTYFNTAMTIMCRIAGVPARYVEGFKSSNKKDDNGLYSVSNADAHAWCEVLLGAFEYSNMWTIVDASPTAAEDMQRKLKELQEQQKNSEDSSDMDINMKRVSQNKMDGIDSEEGDAGGKLKVLSDGQFKVINIVTAVILFILIRIIEVGKMRSKLLKSHGVAPLYNYYLNRLAVVRIVKPEYQSDLEFAAEILDSELKERVGILVKGAYEEFYGRHSVAMLDNKEYYEFLEGYLKEYQGRVGYLLNKYLG